MKTDFDDGLPILLAYQQRWVEDAAPVAVCEKSRRIGISWADAAERVIWAAEGNGDVYYVSYSREATEGYVRDCQFWAERYDRALGEVLDESFLDDSGRWQQRFRLPCGERDVIALVSSPRAARNKGRPGDILILDEAAFCDEMDEVIKAALAFTIWGGRVRIMSTHNGADSAFADLVGDIRAGRLPYSLHRIDLDDAIADGLARRICSVRGERWRDGWADEFRAAELARYRSRSEAQEELFCVPLPTGEAWLSRALIESRMRPMPVLRFEGTAEFNARPEAVRRREVDDWLDDVLEPVLEAQSRDHRDLRHCFGWDFARSGDVSALVPMRIGPGRARTIPFVLEMRNVPHQQQCQIAIRLCEGLPRFEGGAVDGTGVGSFAGEEMSDRFGACVESLHLNEAWYRRNMPPYKAAFEDGELLLPEDELVLDDHRAIKLVAGVPRLPARPTNVGRHGDTAIGGALADYASRRDGGPPEHASTGPRESAAGVGEFAGAGRPDLGGWL